MLRIHPTRSLLSNRVLKRTITTTTSVSPRQSLDNLATLLERYPLVDPVSVQRLRQATKDLDAANRLANVSIVGTREAGTVNLTTAMLDDPLVNQGDVTVALEARRLKDDTTPEAIRIRYGKEVETTEEGQLSIPSNWLNENHAAVTEIVHSPEIAPLESSFSTLHLSDLVILLLSPTSLLSSRAAQTLLLNLHEKPNLVICLDSTNTNFAESNLKTLQHQLDTLFPPSTSGEDSSTTISNQSRPTVMSISTRQALDALAVLTPSAPSESTASTSVPSTSANDFETFQTNYLASRIPQLKEFVSSVLSSHQLRSSDSSVPVSSPSQLQIATARYVLSSVLSRAAFSAAQLSDHLHSASTNLSALSLSTDETTQKLLASLGVDPKSGIVPVSPVEMDGIRKPFEELLGSRYKLYQVLVRLDDLGSELSVVANETYLKEFEREMVYKTGVFESNKETLKNKLMETISKSPFSQSAAPSASSSTSPTSLTATSTSSLASLYSPTIENSIEQSLHPSPTSPSYLPPHSLSSPISSRRSQISAPGGPISLLHSRTQSALISSSILSTTSILSSLGLYLTSTWTDIAQCGSLGLLGTVGGIWYFQGRWEKSKKRFWKDLERVTGGVEEDLGVAVENLVERTTYPTRLAISLYENKLREKMDEFEKVKRELQRIAKDQ